MGILACATLLVMFGKFRFSCFIVGILIWVLAGAAQAQSRLADLDGDGLIDVDSLLMLHNMRHNLAGTSYRGSATSVGSALGCPRRGCNGYELTRHLDFDADGDGSSWSGDSTDGYRLDEGDSRAPYFVVDSDGGGGWQPIGGESNPFTAVFDGNGYSIRNLGIRRDQLRIGLFGTIDGAATIRNLGLVNNLANFIGSGQTLLGGLVGEHLGGSIVASHATGPAVGGSSGHFDYVGGLVGLTAAGSITASYATGPVEAKGGDVTSAGGLVGSLNNASITASYATGPVVVDTVGGGGGGLVGIQINASITASYATGPVTGNKEVGPLVGTLGDGSITASYGFGVAGTASGEIVNTNGAPPADVSAATQLTAANAGPSWNAAADGTQGAWDFGTASQRPALRYADYDGPGPVFACRQVPAGACGSLLPGQDELSRSGPFIAKFGAEVTLSFSLRFDRATISSWRWRQLSGPTVTLAATDSPAASFTAPAQQASLVFRLTAATSAGDEYNELVTLEAAAADQIADADGDGLIDIDSLTRLHNMRHELAGASYKTSATSAGATLGCPATGCNGYELTRDLDFDADGDGRSWTGDSIQGYRLDRGDSRAPYFRVFGGGDGGWEPIGTRSDPFTAVFDGNGYSIHNLASRRDQRDMGLFAAIGEGAAIRNLGLVDNLVNSLLGDDAYVGGLVGRQQGGSITASYATGHATTNYVGTGDAVGGLVGQQSRGSITASYATGPVDGRGGSHDRAGGLVGHQEGGSITASYATGPAAGGSRGNDQVGGLVGGQSSAVRSSASYATGNADGGSGDSDFVGALVGGGGGSITASYGFGGVAGGRVNTRGTPPAGVSVPADLTLALAGAFWNAAADNSQGAWDFGTASQPPLLRYADYDGAGTDFDCRQFPPGACGVLLPGQDVPSAQVPAAALAGAQVSLAGTVDDRISSWRWRQLSGPMVTLTAANSRVASFTAPAQEATLVFELTATTVGGLEDRELFRLSVFARAADDDSDGLIEIRDLTMLHNMRHNLAGTSYRSGENSTGNSFGCPATGCNGYELVGNLDFDADGDGSSWTGDSAASYRLDAGDSRAPYFVVNGGGNGGWQPIGSENNPFVAVFDGNGYAIRNLATSRANLNVGFFDAIDDTAAIRNLGLVNNLADAPNSSSRVGGLVGHQRGGSIVASYATGPVAARFGSGARAGGLVGTQGWRFDHGQLRHRPGRNRRDIILARRPGGVSARRFDHGQLRHRPCRRQARIQRQGRRSRGLPGRRFDHGQLRLGACQWRGRKQ